VQKYATNAAATPDRTTAAGNAKINGHPYVVKRIAFAYPPIAK
jgi:hypothetical protein